MAVPNSRYTKGEEPMNRPVHFEIPVENPERAIKFYEDIFGWKFNKWEGPMDYWLIETGDSTPGINGGLMRRHDPSQAAVNTVEVENVDAACAKITDAGGQIVVPKMAIPGVGYL